MERAITGFGQDDVGDWLAHLECFHRQHVRHKPPFFNRPWVVTEAGRASFLGKPLSCVRCDRLELPEGLTVYRKTPDFTEETLPAGLQRDHSIKPGSWGQLLVFSGCLTLHIHEAVREVRGGDAAAIPPSAVHHVTITARPLSCRIDFLRPAVESGDALV